MLYPVLIVSNHCLTLLWDIQATLFPLQLLWFALFPQFYQNFQMNKIQ